MKKTFLKNIYYYKQNNYIDIFVYFDKQEDFISIYLYAIKKSISTYLHIIINRKMLEKDFAVLTVKV